MDECNECGTFMGICNGAANGRSHVQISFCQQQCPMCQLMDDWECVIDVLTEQVKQLLVVKETDNGKEQ